MDPHLEDVAEDGLGDGGQELERGDEGQDSGDGVLGGNHHFLSLHNAGFSFEHAKNADYAHHESSNQEGEVDEAKVLETH